MQASKRKTAAEEISAGGFPVPSPRPWLSPVLWRPLAINSLLPSRQPAVAGVWQLQTSPRSSQTRCQGQAMISPDKGRIATPSCSQPNARWGSGERAGLLTEMGNRLGSFTGTPPGVHPQGMGPVLWQDSGNTSGPTLTHVPAEPRCSTRTTQAGSADGRRHLPGSSSDTATDVVHASVSHSCL